MFDSKFRCLCWPILGEEFCFSVCLCLYIAINSQSWKNTNMIRCLKPTACPWKSMVGSNKWNFFLGPGQSSRGCNTFLEDTRISLYLSEWVETCRIQSHFGKLVCTGNRQQRHFGVTCTYQLNSKCPFVDLSNKKNMGGASSITLYWRKIRNFSGVSLLSLKRTAWNWKKHTLPKTNSLTLKIGPNPKGN